MSDEYTEFRNKIEKRLNLIRKTRIENEENIYSLMSDIRITFTKCDNKENEIKQLEKRYKKAIRFIEKINQNTKKTTDAEFEKVKNYVDETMPEKMDILISQYDELVVHAKDELSSIKKLADKNQEIYIKRIEELKKDTNIDFGHYTSIKTAEIIIDNEKLYNEKHYNTMNPKNN